MALATRLTELATAIGVDTGALRKDVGTLSGLTTTAKGSLVAAINEVAGRPTGAQINDSTASATTTYSSNKINADNAGILTTIRGGVVAAGDNLSKVYTIATNAASAASTAQTAANNRVRFDAAQTLTAAQQKTASENIGVGDPETDLVAVYTTAKA